MVQENGTYRVHAWPDPGPSHTVGAVGWLVALHVTKVRAGWGWGWRPDPVLIVGNPTMAELWQTTRVSAHDWVAVELLGPARVLRRYDLPAGLRLPRALAPTAPLVSVQVLDQVEALRLGRPPRDLVTVLGQPRPHDTAVVAA